MNHAVFLNAVRDKLGRQIQSDESDTIKSYLSGIRIPPLTSLKLAFRYHLERVVEQMKKIPNTPEEIDIHEYQKQMIGTVAERAENPQRPMDVSTAETAKLEALFLLQVGEIYDLSKELAPKSKMKYSYLMLDSANCYEFNGTRDKFTWLLQEEKIVLRPGYINLHSKLRNIKMARIGRMTMAHMPTTFAVDAVARNRFSFGFDEFTSQALITPEGVKFQFAEFLSESDTNYGTTIVLSPFNMNRGWFRFRERFKTLDKLSLNIYNLNTGVKVILPDVETSFPARKTAGTTVSDAYTAVYNNPILIPNGSLYLPIDYYFGSVGFEYDVPADVAESVIFSDMDSGDAVADAQYNGQTKTLRLINSGNYFEIISGADPVFPAPAFFLYHPFTITLIYKPRFTGVLELISEDDSDDDIPE